MPDLYTRQDDLKANVFILVFTKGFSQIKDYNVYIWVMLYHDELLQYDVYVYDKIHHVV